MFVKILGIIQYLAVSRWRYTSKHFTYRSITEYHIKAALAVVVVYNVGCDVSRDLVAGDLSPALAAAVDGFLLFFCHLTTINT